MMSLRRARVKGPTRFAILGVDEDSMVLKRRNTADLAQVLPAVYGSRIRRLDWTLVESEEICALYWSESALDIESR